MNRYARVFFLMFILPLLASAGATDKVIELGELWINEAPPVAKVHAAYLTIHNSSNLDIFLEKIESADYQRIEIHQSILDGEKATMKAHEKLEIKANSTLKMEPGALHLMLFTPSRRMLSGDTSTFTFHFSNKLQVTSDASVKKLSSVHSHHSH